MNILYYTYPWAMDVPGGGERQLMAYRDHLAKFSVEGRLFDMWNPCFSDASIFHCFSAMSGTVEMCDFAKRKGLKLIISPNLWVTRETKDQYPVKVIWNLFEMADAVIVNSEMELKALSDTFGFNESKFHVVHNAAEADFLLEEDGRYFAEAYGIQGPYVLNVANIEPRKNQLRFIEVLREERPDLTCVIIGNIRDDAYGEACRQAGGEHLKVVGALPYASKMLRSAISGCEFFAMPSLLETPSIAAIEAALSGARVLLTNKGSTTEYFGDSVTYVTPDSNSSMAAGIHAASQASSESSKWVSRHSYIWPKVMPELIRVYQSVILMR